jgi:hypothetical protein
MGQGLAVKPTPADAAPPLGHKTPDEPARRPDLLPPKIDNPRPSGAGKPAPEPDVVPRPGYQAWRRRPAAGLRSTIPMPVPFGLCHLLFEPGKFL